MKITFVIEADDPADAWHAQELARQWEEGAEPMLKELAAPCEIDDSMGADLGEIVHRTLQDFVQFKRRAVGRMRRRK